MTKKEEREAKALLAEVRKMPAEKQKKLLFALQVAAAVCKLQEADALMAEAMK